MDEQTPHIHIDFVPFICNSKRGLDTRVSLKGALSEQGFKGGTRGMTEWNEWIEAEKQELSKVMGRHGVQWKQLGTHNKHLSVLDFEKKERAKEVAELEQTISDSKEKLSDILHQQIAAGQETEQIRKEGEAIRQEVSELTATNHLLKEQTETMAEDKEKLLSENEKLEKQQKKLQQELNKMVQSKEIMERNIHAYDEDVKWQLAEPGALMSAKAYRDNFLRHSHVSLLISKLGAQPNLVADRLGHEKIQTMMSIFSFIPEPVKEPCRAVKRAYGRI